MKAKIYYIDKKTKKTKSTFDQIYRKTKYIERADDRSRILGNKVARFLLTTIAGMLTSNPEKIVFIDHEFISSITDCKVDQNRNLLNQLTDILDFKYHHTIEFQGIRRHFGYTIKFTPDGPDRLENPGLYYNINKATVNKSKQIGLVTEKNQTIDQNKSDNRPKKIGLVTEKNQTRTTLQPQNPEGCRVVRLYKEDKEEVERDIAYSNISLSTSPKERKKERKGETDTATEKPRIRIAAVSQKICQVKEEPSLASHSLGQASELGSSPIPQEPKPALKPQKEASKPKIAKQAKTEPSAVCLTAEEEQQHYDLHKQRKASESSNGFKLIQFDQAEAVKPEAPPEYQTYEDIRRQHEEERGQQVIALHKQREIELAEYNAKAKEKTPWRLVLDRFLEHDYTVQDPILGERLVKKDEREQLVNGFLKLKTTIDLEGKHIEIQRQSEHWGEWFNLNFKGLFSGYFAAEGFSFNVT